MFPGGEVDGVFAMWYAKGPGVDRSGDVFRHANLAGTTEHGGVLVVFGDDHPGKSSTVAHQSEQALAANLIPVLYPANVEEILEYGLHGWAMSRYTGLWVGLKTVNETVETTATVPVLPGGPAILAPNAPDDGVDIRPQPDYGPQRDETVVIRHRLPRVHDYARANLLDRRRLGAAGARLGIVTSGKAYTDLVDALALLGIDEDRARTLGLSVYKVGLIWPLEPVGLRGFAAGCEELLFVEEKRAFIEDQAAKLLINDKEAPRFSGKNDPQGEVLLPSDVQLDPATIAAALLRRLEALGLADAALRQAGERVAVAKPAVVDPAQPKRLPYFCSGCPHNSSTKVPEGSVAMSGIGCHSMAMWMNRNTLKPVQMGAEGTNWIGLSHFTTTRHVFQNLGDGTYSHSGLLAIRAAVQAGVNITYKILANDAVAMTGGQPVEGALSTEMIVRQVLAEDIARCMVVTDDLARTAVSVPGVSLVPRAELARVQQELSAIPGVTVLVYEQVCAAEKRRRRKRGLFPDPAKRVFINERVCEGCGDCSVASNCVSVQPLETELGRKRRIDQSNCNKDFSCIEGFCPSFVMVQDPKLRKADRTAADPKALFADLPAPAASALSAPYNILITGIGGTGVITIGALLGMAAHVEGLACSTLDFTGLSQKNGAVMSHVRLAPASDMLTTVRIAPGNANLILGCDLVVATSVPALSRAERGVTRAVVNADLLPTASFVIDPDIDFEASSMRDALNGAVTPGDLDILDATGLATALMGDSIATNAFMLGFAFQRGAIPLSLEAILKAIELNGAAIEMNKTAFSWGRLAAHDLQRVVSAARFKNAGTAPAKKTLDEAIAFRAKFLTDYQDAAYAKRYLDDVARVRTAETGGGAGLAGSDRGFCKRPVQADGLQGRIRGRAALFRRRVQQGLAGAVRGQLRPEGPAGAAAIGAARSGHRALAEARIRAVGLQGIRTAGGVEGLARHRIRHLRLHRRAQDGACIAGGLLGDDPASSRRQKAARSAAPRGAGEGCGPRARLWPHQGRQRGPLSHRMRAAGARDRSAAGSGGRIGQSVPIASERGSAPAELSAAALVDR